MDLRDALLSLSLADEVHGKTVFVIDLQYGFPKERRPRREKIGAIAKQLANFRLWQQAYGCAKERRPVSITLVHLEQDKDAVMELIGRLGDIADATDVGTQCQSSKNHPLIQTTSTSLKQIASAMKGKAIYLSPDAETVLSSSPKHCPLEDDLSCIIVGGLIDRKHIQEYRSLSRAKELDIPAARWPMPADWDTNEPLNVDCILQGMQSWIWTGNLKESIAEALATHIRRHPGRPRHKPSRPIPADRLDK